MAQSGGAVRKCGSAGALCLLAWVAVRAGQQTPAEPPAVFRSGVDIVTLDVSVLDGRRQPVRGLTAADFTVIENGSPQPIVAFKAIDLPDRRAYAAPWMRDVAPDVVNNRLAGERVVVLLLDDFNISLDPADAHAAIEIGRAIINELGPSDLAAVVYTFAHQKMQEFTTDRARLLGAVEQFRSSAFPNIPGASGLPRAQGEATTAILRGIAGVLNQWPERRKAIAYISPEAAYQIGPQNVEQSSFEKNAMIFNSGPELQKTFQALQEANVNVYQYDPRGLKESLDILHPLGMFADNTGGRAVTRSNAPWERVPEMFAENSSYYMIGFRPTTPNTDGRFHPISVRVSRPDVEVRTRAGYYPPTVTTAVKPERKQTTPIDKAMAGALPSGDLPMSLTVAPFAAPGRATGAVAIIAGLDRSPEMPAKDVVDIAARAYDQSRLDRRSTGVATAKLQLSRRTSAAGTVHYDVGTRLDLAPGRYQVRLAMNSPANAVTGSVFADVTVPDFANDPLSLSGVVLGRPGAPRPTGRDPLATLLPFMPTTTRDFSPTERVTSFLRIYQPAKKAPVPVTVVTRLVDQTNRPVFEQTTTVDAVAFLVGTGTADHQLELPLSKLQTGEYLLSIEATAGATKRTRNVRIRVE